MQKNNQFFIDFKGAELAEITFDDFVEWNGEEHRKVKGVFIAPGEHDNSEELTVTFFDKVADIVAGLPDGTRLDVSAKVRTRYIMTAKGEELDITEVIGYYVEETGSRRNRDTRARETERREQQREAPHTTTRASSGGDTRAPRPTRPAPVETGNAGRTGSGRTVNRNEDGPTVETHEPPARTASTPGGSSGRNRNTRR